MIELEFGFTTKLNQFAGKERNQHLGQTQKLEELGFTWKLRLDQWETRLRELREFKKEHGHCNIPSRHSGGLEVWVHRQRSEKLRGCLDAGLNQKLDELGYG